MSRGTYSLVIGLGSPATVTFGAAGDRDLAAGWYVYTGSALGPEGFARLERHRALARGERDVRHWHVDHLLGHPESGIEAVVTSPGRAIECAVARAVDADAVPGVGASDCACPSHLAFGGPRDPTLRAARRAHEAARLGGDARLSRG